MSASRIPGVLFLCTHNAGRSQMGAGFMRSIAGDKVRVLSGGSRSAQRSTGQPPLSPASTSEPEWVRRKRLPKPPSMDEYRSAGVDADSCGFCQKRTTERAREWRYMVLDGRPAVVCPTCWRKHVTNNSDAGAAAFEARIGSKVWNSPRIEDTYRGLRGE